LQHADFQYLDLRAGSGNLLGQYWEINSPSLGEWSALNTGLSHSGARESCLSAILQAIVPLKYYLSKTACLGILRRAARRGKFLPGILEKALKMQAGMPSPDPQPVEFKAYHINQRDEGIDLVGISGALIATQNMQMQTFVTQEEPTAFACNQRDEVRDLNDVAAAVCAHPSVKQQTFVAMPINTQIATRHERLGDGTGLGIGDDGDPAFTLQAAHSHAVFAAGFCTSAGAKAGGIGYQEETAPTLKGSPSGNLMPSVLCLNDQGGQRMDVTENQVGTLRAQMDGHPPLVMAT